MVLAFIKGRVRFLGQVIKFAEALVPRKSRARIAVQLCIYDSRIMSQQCVQKSV